MFSWLRWYKMFREMRSAHAPLVVLCLSLGATIVGIMLNTQDVLNSNISREFASSNAASAYLMVGQGFDDGLVKAIRKVRGVAEAEGRRVVSSRIRTGPEQFVSIQLFGIDNYRHIQINKVLPERGAWPPQNNDVLLERASLRLGRLQNLKLGDSVDIKMASGKFRALDVTGLTYDFNQEPATAAGKAYGYVTLDTLEALGEPRSYNQLLVTVADNTSDETYIREVVERVKQKIEDSGNTVQSTAIPEPGKYPLADAFTGLGVALVGLGLLTLAGGIFLVINTVSALLAQQVRQIGVMKAIGATDLQLMVMYLGFILVYSLVALLVSAPLAALGGSLLSSALGNAFNINLEGSHVSLGALGNIAGLVLGLPLLATLFPIIAGTRVTVREAISDYGFSKAGGPSVLDRLLERIERIPRPILLSLRNTVRRKGRLIFTLTALMLSGAVFMAATNVRGAMDRAVEQIFTYRTYQLRISFDQSYRLKRIEQSMLSVPGVSRVEGHNGAGATRKRADDSLGGNVGVLAFDPASTTFRPPVIAGRWLRPGGQAEAVVNTAYLRDEPMQVGDTVEFKIGRRDKVTLQIVGITEEALAPPSMYLDNTFFQRQIGNADLVNGAWVMIDGRSPSEVARDLEAQLAGQGLKTTKLDTIAQEKDYIAAHTAVLTLFLQIMAVLLMAVGSLGLMGTMSINVIERRREIGIMRAVGASNRSIEWIVIVEGIFVGVMSWLLSAVATVVPTKLIGDAIGSQFLHAPLQFTYVPSGPLLWLITIVLVAGVACYLPARRAAQIQVRDLLSYE